MILLLLSGYLEAKEVVLAKVKPGGSTDAAFNLYTMYFELKTNVSVARVPIVFANLPRGMSGVCLRWTNGRRKILVDKHIWYKMFTFEQKMQLIWHELGHCRLDSDGWWRAHACLPTGR